MKRVSIKDIARAAGVSHPTVSRALRGDRRISEETTQRILSLAQDMGYSPNVPARSLVTGRTGTVGLVVTTIADPFVAPVVDGVEQVAVEKGYTVILATSKNDSQRELEVVRLLQERRVDGIIVAASRVGASYVSRIATTQIPVVLINNQAHGNYVYSVNVDDVYGARLAVAHLVQLGHRAIAYIGCPRRPRSEKHRRQGYLSEMAATGLPVPEDWILSREHPIDDVERGVDGLTRLLSLREPPTAVFCYNDMTAIGALKCAADCGVRVPEDISVVGFDDIYQASLVRPTLTTVRQPKETMGQEAMKMIYRLLAGEQVRDVTFRPALVTRASSGAPTNQETTDLSTNDQVDREVWR